ncbi:MAG: CBS domain-containing protein [Candidatus Nanohaloarchaea archaeon]
MIPALDDLREQIVSMRHDLDMTQAEAADAADVSQSFVAKLEAGTTAPNYDAAARLYNALERLQEREAVTARDIMTADIASLSPDDAVSAAAETMRAQEFSQLPVMADDRCVGSVTSRSLLDADPEATVGDVMAAPFPTVPVDTTADAVRELLRSTNAVLVTDDDEIAGIITAADLL